MAIKVIDAAEAHLPGIRDIFNQAVRETFAIWSETETTLDQRRAWLAARTGGKTLPYDTYHGRLDVSFVRPEGRTHERLGKAIDIYG